jgi:hypothetical protein
MQKFAAPINGYQKARCLVSDFSPPIATINASGYDRLNSEKLRDEAKKQLGEWS